MLVIAFLLLGNNCTSTIFSLPACLDRGDVIEFESSAPVRETEQSIFVCWDLSRWNAFAGKSGDLERHNANVLSTEQWHVLGPLSTFHKILEGQGVNGIVLASRKFYGGTQTYPALAFIERGLQLLMSRQSPTKKRRRIIAARRASTELYCTKTADTVVFS